MHSSFRKCLTHINQPLAEKPTRIDRANEFRACFLVDRSERIDQRQRGIFDNKACQAAGRIGARVDIDPVWS